MPIISENIRLSEKSGPRPTCKEPQILVFVKFVDVPVQAGCTTWRSSGSTPNGRSDGSTLAMDRTEPEAISIVSHTSEIDTVNDTVELRVR